MSSMELNKIVAAVLLAGVIAMTTGFLAELLVAPEDLEENAYLVEMEGVEAPVAEEEEQVPLAVLLASADPAEGESFVRACASCHSFEQGGANRVGPNLWNVVGQDKGRVDGFNYSSAMQAAEGDWTYEALDGFLHQPRSYLSGTSMSYAGIRDAEDRANVIAYLRTLSDEPLPLPEPPAEEPAAEEGAADTEGAAAGEGEQPAGQTAADEAATAAPPAEPAGAGEAGPAAVSAAGPAVEAATAEEAADEAEADAATAATEGGMAAEDAAADAEAAAATAEREAESLAETGGAAAQEAEDAAIDAEQAAGQAERAASETAGETAGEGAPAQQAGEVATGTGEDQAEIRAGQEAAEGTQDGATAELQRLEEETGEALAEGAAGAAGEAGELDPAHGAATDVDVDFVPVPEGTETEQVLEPAVPGSMGDEPGPVGSTPAEEPEGPLEPPVTVQEGLVEEQEVEVQVDPDDVIAIEPGEPGQDITEEVVPADRGPPE